MFNVTNTLHPRIVKEVVEYALKQRFLIKDEEQKQEAIVISDEWAN